LMICKDYLYFSYSLLYEAKRTNACWLEERL
jgi:hypothetical protein